MFAGGDANVTRILIVDDNRAIHHDLRKVLLGDALGGELQQAAAALFGDAPAQAQGPKFEIDSAFQGIDALEMLRAALVEGRPYAMAFVDMRMPPGWDGVETIEHFWKVDPDLQVCICTAFSDYSWSEITDRLKNSDGWLILKKPFDNIEVAQVAAALSEKRRLMSIASMRLQDLEQRVEERTAALNATNEQLRNEIVERLAAEAMLHERDEQLAQAKKLEALGTLAGGIAHEFNNLLQIVIGYGQCAVDELPTANPMRHDLEQVLKAANRAAALTGQLLGFSRQQPLQIAQIDVNALVAEFMDLARPLFGERISISASLDPAIAGLPADADQLRQVLLNLAINARDAMPGDGALRIATRRCKLPAATPGQPGPPAGDYVEIAVSDNGHGIAADVRHRVFEPFYTTKEVGKGSGLGLSMVHGIIRQHGGDISFTSEEGRGTTFRVLLPVTAPQSAAADADDAPTDAHALAEPGEENGATILVVEDDVQVRSILSRTLSHAGYRVIEAEHGLAALEVYDRTPEIDLALVDVVMPKMGGWELFTELRLRRPGIPAIFCTGYDPRGAKTGHLAACGMPVLRKPVSRDGLLREVRRALFENATEGAASLAPSEAVA